MCGLADTPEDARRVTPAVPKISIVSPPHDYALANGLRFVASEVDMLGRIVSSQNFHNSYAVTGAMATIAAAVVPGSVVNRVVGHAAERSPLSLKIGHASGVIGARQEWHPTGDGVMIDRTYMIRTARRLMTGSAYVAQFAAAVPPADLRTTNMWTSAPTRNGSSVPDASIQRVTAR